MIVTPSETAVCWVATGAAPVVDGSVGVEGVPGLGEALPGGAGVELPEAQAAANSNDGRAIVRI
jgi:hypothetical protein